MATSLSSSSSILLSTFYLSSLPFLSPTTIPLAYKCSPSHQPSQNTTTTTQSLLKTIAPTASRTGFSIESVGRIDGLMQCRPDLSPADCTLCLRTGTNTISTLCMNSEAVSAWFDGCYIHYQPHSQATEFYDQTRPFETRSNQSLIPDQARFAVALHGLLLQLRSDVGIKSQHGFSFGERSYGDGLRVYASVECVRSVSPPEKCEACVSGAIETIHKCCSGKVGGVVVAGDCAVRFESYYFLLGRSPPAGGPESYGRTYDESGRGDGCKGFKVKVLWAWGVTVACFVGVVLGAWFLRRRILSVKVRNLAIDKSDGRT